MPEPRLVIDCGAYAGYSTLYFLNKYKNAHVIAIEPDRRNLDLCRLNLLPYMNRVTLVEGAVWPEATPLVLRTGEWLGTTREWASKAEIPQSSEPSNVMAVELGALLRESRFTHIDLLKASMWSEETIFSRNYQAWLPHVRNMMIRLISDKAENAFLLAMSEYRFFLTRRSGVHVCTSIGAPPVRIPRAAPPTANTLSNGDFEELRVASAQIIEGGWVPGASDPAADWKTVVCDPQFSVSLAIRTGLQYAGENALHVGVNGGIPLSSGSAPYVAIQNTGTIPVSAGEQWQIRARIAAHQNRECTNALVRGAYVFLRLEYSDGTSEDMRTEPLSEAASPYSENTATIVIPEPPPGCYIESARTWVYVWLANSGPTDIETVAGMWDVYFDDVSCRRVPDRNAR